MIKNPEDRWDNARKLVEAGGGTLLHFYITYGECDFLMIAEASSAEDCAPFPLTAASTGGIAGMTTVPAMSTADAKRGFEGAHRVRDNFKPATG